ncbi:DUF4365 domain-containing protein [Pseudomonas asiatica]|uniref:DUF4365 domain-containing protein n=1 Tax=Pseudomonas asiatica TaxID=2219225 RepID=UPI0018AB1C1D|nr:DUF4365 domain-containing protein [Pseudomonas asiatica]MBF8789043.1 DUF4365 domain-containing protein [Pseudomonas asiatica]
MNTLNFDQGSCGESLAAYYLSVIFNGEAVKETMRGEGVGALDLQLRIKTYGAAESYLQAGIQVKTGSSFARWTKTKNRWRLQNIDAKHIEKWRSSNQPVLLIWVRLDPRIKIYWKMVTRTTPVGTLSLSENHVLDPAARFEIERLLHKSSGRISNPPHFQVTSASSTSGVRAQAAQKFKRVRGAVDCCLGKVRVSNYAWRHLTRITRPQSHIQDSLIALMFVKNILGLIPHQIQTLPVEVTSNGKVVTVHRKVLAIYRNITFQDKGRCVVYVRLDEKIIFEANWKETAHIRSKVIQDIKLESIYRKTQNT